MYTNELASTFNITHRDVVRLVETSLSKNEFSSDSIKSEFYISSQNKKIKNYKLTNDVVAYLLSSKLCFTNKIDRKIRATEILDDIGYKTKVVIGDRVRSEEIFYGDLVKFCSGLSVIRQYPVKGYLVDFFIPEAGLYIEYQEPYHFTLEQKKADRERFSVIEEELTKLNEGVKPFLLVVNEGKEIEALSKLAGLLCLVSAQILTSKIDEDSFLI